MRNVLLEGFTGSEGGVKTTERVRNNLEGNQERRESAGVSRCAISAFTLSRWAGKRIQGEKMNVLRDE